MSRVLLIAADKPLPLCSHCEIRTKTVVIEGNPYTISFPRGFQISEHSYYRSCVDGLGLPMKPYQYELDLERNETDLHHLRAYLSENFSPGETVELWNIWQSNDFGSLPPHYHGSFTDLDMDTLAQFLTETQNDEPGQCWLSITI